MCTTRFELERKYAESSIALTRAVQKHSSHGCIKVSDAEIERAAAERERTERALIEHIERHRC